MVSRFAFLCALGLASTAFAADPTVVGAFIGGGGTGDVYELTVGDKRGVIKVLRSQSAAAKREFAAQFDDYKLAASRYFGVKLLSQELVEVRLPNGTVTRGIFMEQAKGLRLDKAIALLYGAKSPPEGIEAIARAAGFTVTEEHLRQLYHLQERLVHHRETLVDLNGENIILVSPADGYIKVIDPTIEPLPKDGTGERVVENALAYVRFELDSVASAAPKSNTWTCVIRMGDLYRERPRPPPGPRR